MSIFEIVLCVIGAWFIIVAFLNKTKNVGSTIFYQIIPFVCGAYCIFFSYSLKGVAIVLIAHTIYNIIGNSNLTIISSF